MQASAELAADSMIQNVGFNHPSQGNSTNYYIVLGPRDKAAPPTSQQIGQFLPKRVKCRHRHPFLFLPHPQESCLCSQPIRDNVRSTGRTIPERVERSFLDSQYRFVAVRWILPTRFAKQKFVQLRTNSVGLGSPNNPNYVREANVRPIKNWL